MIAHLCAAPATLKSEGVSDNAHCEHAHLLGHACHNRRCTGSCAATHPCCDEHLCRRKSAHLTTASRLLPLQTSCWRRDFPASHSAENSLRRVESSHISIGVLYAEEHAR